MLKKIEFVKAVYKASDLPKNDIPEIVLCGRSNVGKSSFINSLFNRKSIAKTSSSPGKTRSLNFYLVESKFYIVDLPGFGYAKVSKSERNYWNSMLEDYFSNRKQIILSFHLIDCRHEPTPLDIQLNNFLRTYNIPYTIILNKADKLKRSELSSAKKRVKKIFPELEDGKTLLLYSSIDNMGKQEILQMLEQIIVNSFA